MFDFDLNPIFQCPWMYGDDLNASERLKGCKLLSESLEKHVAQRQEEIAVMQKRLKELEVVMAKLRKDAAIIAAMDASEPFPGKWESEPSVILLVNKWERA